MIEKIFIEISVKWLLIREEIVMDSANAEMFLVCATEPM